MLLALNTATAKAYFLQYDKSCDCITRLESLKDEFNLKAINIKINLVLKIENLKDEITNIRKDI